MKIQRQSHPIHPCLLALVAVGTVTVPLAKASILASEDFNYSAGVNLSDGSVNGGTGWNGNYAVGAPDLGYLNETRNGAPLSYPNYPAAGGTYANLASGYGGPSFNYFQRTVSVNGAFSAYNDGTRVGKDGTVLWGSFLYNKVSGLQMWLQGAGNTIFTLPTGGSNSLFVYRISYGAGNADTVTIWNNPDLSTWTPAASPTSTASGDFSFQTLVFVAPDSTNEGRVDNIRFGTEAIDVVPYTVTTTAFQSWAISNGLDPQTDGAPDFDKDGDGSKNLSEYAFLTDPKSGSSLPKLSQVTDATNLSLTYLRAKAATDVTFTAEWSTNLQNWFTSGLTDVATGTEDANSAEYKATITKGTDEKKFLRIHVTLNTP